VPIHIRPDFRWFAQGLGPSPTYGSLPALCPATCGSMERPSSYPDQSWYMWVEMQPRVPLPNVGVTFIGESEPSLQRALPSFIALTDSCVNPVTSPHLRPWPRSRSLCRLLSAPAANGTFSTLFCDSFLRCLSPYHGGPTECSCLVLPQCLRPSPR
jgi:hypothetical protein